MFSFYRHLKRNKHSISKNKEQTRDKQVPSRTGEKLKETRGKKWEGEALGPQFNCVFCSLMDTPSGKLKDKEHPESEQEQHFQHFSSRQAGSSSRFWALTANVNHLKSEMCNTADRLHLTLFQKDSCHSHRCAQIGSALSFIR